MIDLEHFMESFLALRSNHEPRLLPMGLLFGLLLLTLLGPTWPTTPERLEKVLDFCSIFMSILPSRLMMEVAQRGQYAVNLLLSLFYAQFIITYQSSVPKPWKENTNTAEQASKRAYLSSGLKTHKSSHSFPFCPSQVDADYTCKLSC